MQDSVGFWRASPRTAFSVYGAISALVRPVRTRPLRQIEFPQLLIVIRLTRDTYSDSFYTDALYVTNRFIFGRV